MNIRKSILLLGASLALAFTINAGAQTATNAPGPGNFFSTVQEWATVQNTNLDTFTADRLDVWAGMDYQQNVNVSASLGIQAPIYKHWLTLESVTRNAGIAGTILSEQIGGGLSYSRYDLRFSAFAGGGYRFDVNDPFGYGALQATKAMTRFTYLGLRCEADFFSRAKLGMTPVVTLFTGFTF